MIDTFNQNYLNTSTKGHLMNDVSNQSEHIKNETIIQEEKKIKKNIVRVIHDKDHPYVIMNRKTACDYSLAPDTQGILCRLLCNADNWEISIPHLMKKNRIGRDKIYRILGELIEKGYAYCYQERSKGKFSSNVWVIFETPKTDDEIQKMFTNTENPYTVKPHTANPQPISNIDIISNKKNNIYTPPQGGASLLPPPSPPCKIATDQLPPPEPPSSFSGAKKKKPPNPKVPFNTGVLVSRLPNHIHNQEFTNRFERPLIATTDEEHKRLIEKYSESKVNEFYSRLADWKISKLEIGDLKSVRLNSDIYRINHWVKKEILDTNTQKSRRSLNRGKLAISADERAQQDNWKPEFAKSDDEYSDEEMKESMEDLERLRIKRKKEAEERKSKQGYFR